MTFLYFSSSYKGSIQRVELLPQPSGLLSMMFPALPPLALLQAHHCAVLCDSLTRESHPIATLLIFMGRNMDQFAMATDLPQEPQYVPKQQQQKVIPDECLFNWETLMLYKKRGIMFFMLGTGKLRHKTVNHF